MQNHKQKKFREMSSTEFKQTSREIVENSNCEKEITDKFYEMQYPYMIVIEDFEPPQGTKFQECLLKDFGFIRRGDGKFVKLIVWNQDGLQLDF